MAYNIEIRPLARIDIWEAYDWYELKKDGLGIEFLDELDSFFKIVQQNPFTFSFYDWPVRQGSLIRFPYTVVYEVLNNTIVIYTIFMTRQDPSKKRTQ